MAKKKMNKTIEDSVVKIEVLEGAQGEMRFDFNSLPDDICTKMGPFGLNHKLGDSAAGKTGVEAEEAINKVWQGLLDGDWSVRAPSAPKVSTKVIADNFSNLSEDEQNAAKAVLESLGIAVPGVTAEEPAESEAAE